MKLLFGLIFAFSVLTTFAATPQVYKWKLNSCGPLQGSFYTDRDSDLSRFAFIEIDFRSGKECTLKRLTQDGWRSTSQEYSYSQLPSSSWSFGCEISEIPSQFRLYISLSDGIYHYGQDEITIEPATRDGGWTLKHSSRNQSPHAINQYDYRQECQLTKM